MCFFLIGLANRCLLLLLLAILSGLSVYSISHGRIDLIVTVIFVTVVVYYTCGR